MKKVLLSLIIALLLLTSCGGNETKPEKNDMLEISYDVISRSNNRRVLMDKYDYISESATYYNIKGTYEKPDWSMDYHKTDDVMNLKFVMGNTINYYYNGHIYGDFKEGEIRYLIPFKSSYDEDIKNQLKRENTLNYVFYEQISGEEIDEKIKVSYRFTLTSDILPEFKYWDAFVGDIVQVDYVLNKDYEILNYEYHLVDDQFSENPVLTKIMSSKTIFNRPYKFPEAIYEYDKAPKVNFTIRKNFMLPSEITESFTVPQNVKIWGNNFIDGDIFIDERLTEKWDFETNYVTEDTTIYIVPEQQKIEYIVLK